MDKSAEVSVIDSIFLQHVGTGSRYFNHGNQDFDQQILDVLGGNLIHIRYVALWINRNEDLKVDTC